MINSKGKRGFQTGQIVTITFAHAFHDTYTAFLSPIIPRLIEKFSLMKAEAGLLSVFMQLPSLFQPLIGHIMEHREKKWIIILSPPITAFLMSLIGIMPSYILLAILLIVVGVSSAFLHAVTPVLIGNLAGDRLGKGMGFWMVGGELGRTLGPVIIVSVLSYWSLEGTHRLILPAIISAFIIYFLLYNIKTLPQKRKPVRTPWKVIYNRLKPIMIPLSWIILLRAMLAGSLNVYLPTFLTEKGNTLFFAGISLAVYESAGIIGAFMGGWLSDHLGRRRILYIAFASAPLLLLISLFLRGLILFPVLLLLGFSALSTGPVILTIVQEGCPENKSLANGTYMGLSFILRSIAVITAGAIADAFGLQTTYIAASILMFSGLPIIRKLPVR